MYELIEEEMKKVSKKEFYDSFSNKDAVHTIDDSKGFPYTSLWTLRGSREIIAKSVPTDNHGLKELEYFIKL